MTTPPQPPDLATAAWHLMQQFVEANNRYGEAAAGAEPGPGRGRIRALFLLREQPMTLAQLAEAHGVDHPYATIIVDKLEALGFAERRPHPATGAASWSA